MSASFDRFMVVNTIGTNRKIRRLPVAQRWAYVAGVLALASQSPIRGALLITDTEPVTAEDIAEEATVKIADARAALAAFRRLGMIERDEHGIEWVHGWDDINPAPKPSDSPEAARERKRAQRAREREGCHADVTRDNGVTTCVTSHSMSRESHAPEVKERKEPPPLTPPQGGKGVTSGVTRERKKPPPGGNAGSPTLTEESPTRPPGGRKTDQAAFDAQMTTWANEYFPDAHPGAVGAAVSWLATRTTGPVTAKAVRDLAATNEIWAAQLSPTAQQATAA